MNLQDIQPLSDFQRNVRAHIRRAKKTGQPAVLTVNGHAEIVVQDIKSYQALVAKAEEAEDIRRLRRSLAEARAGHVYDAEKAFELARDQTLWRHYQPENPKEKMKRYRVVITSEVFRNTDDIFDYVAMENPRAAAKIVREFRERIRSLAAMPRRCPLAPENDILDHDEVRHLVHGKYRIIYVIENRTVYILEIRHGARLPHSE